MKIAQQRVTDDARFQKRFRVSDMNIGDKVIFRPVNGPIHIYFHLWPTSEEDPLTKVMTRTWRGATVERDVDNLLVKLAKVDKALKTKHASKEDASKIRSIVRKQDRYIYAIIRRNTGEEPKVEIMEANWSVKEAIKESSEKTDPMSGNKMLLHGLSWMYDWMLEKGKNAKTGYPAYSCIPYQGMPQGKVPVEYLDPKVVFANKAQFFSAEDLALIENCDWELEEQDSPVAPERIAEMLMEHPVDISRRDKRNPSIFLFFNDKTDLEALQQFSKAEGLNLTTPVQDEVKALPEKTAQVTGKEIKDANYQVVDEKAPEASGANVPGAAGGPASTSAPVITPTDTKTIGGNGPVVEETPVVNEGQAKTFARPPIQEQKQPDQTDQPGQTDEKGFKKTDLW